MTLTPLIIADDAALTVTLPDEGPPFLRGAALLALLAVPPIQAADSQTLNAWRAWGRVAVDLLEGLDPTWSARPQPIPPLVMTMNLPAATNAVDRMQHALEKRMGAAAAYGQLRRAAEPDTGRHREETTLNGAAVRVIDSEAMRRQVLANHGHEVPARFPQDSRNFETRVMRESLPILCLAWAVADAIALSVETLAAATPAEQSSYGHDVNGRDGQVRPQISFADILANAAVQDWVIRRAVHMQGSVLPNLPAKSRQRPVLLQAV